MVEASGADLVDLNFGCPVRKVTKTGAGATLLDDPGRAAGIVEAIADAVDLPVSVKLRRGMRDGSRDCLAVGPMCSSTRGASSLTLHPRSAQQMYTGEADHALTAELVSLVDVPVVASGDIVSRAKAQVALATTGAAAVMVGAAQGNPWVLEEIVDARGASQRARRSSPSSSSSSARTVRELASVGRAGS